jgi:hypothetical protein
MAYGLNGSDDNRLVELQGKENEARQAELVNSFFWLAGKILDGTDATTRQPENVNGNAQGVNLNPSTGEFFKVGVPSTDTSQIKRQNVSDAPLQRFPPVLMALAAVALYLVLKKA